MNTLKVGHPTDQEPPASIQHIITSMSTSVVEVTETVILLDLVRLTMAMGRIQAM
jgi:hypothetical protein